LAERNDSANRSNNRKKVKPEELARTAVQTLARLTGRQPETVLGLRRDDEGWKVMVEVVELSRVPSSTDVLGCYSVSLDEQGEVLGYERSRRYQRGQVGGDE
jgi:hypothetical protein